MIRTALLLALLATPSLALDRGDGRAIASPRLHAPPYLQAGHVISACPTGGGGCEWIGEHANATDYEWDGRGDDLALDGDAVPAPTNPGDPEGDYWSHPGYSLAYGMRDYHVSAQVLLFDTGIWAHTFDPPAAGVSSVVANVTVPAAITTVPGYTFRMWEHHSAGAYVHMFLICEGHPYVEWNSTVGGPLPVVAYGSATECRWTMDTGCSQVASPTPQTTECTASSGWWYELTVIQGGGGCGIGVELLAVLPWLWLRRR